MLPTVFPCDYIHFTAGGYWGTQTAVQKAGSGTLKTRSVGVACFFRVFDLSFSKMTTTPRIRGRYCVRGLEQLGFSLVCSCGSHVVVPRVDRNAELVMPDHREVDRGTLRAIIRQVARLPSHKGIHAASAPR